MVAGASAEVARARLGDLPGQLGHAPARRMDHASQARAPTAGSGRPCPARAAARPRTPPVLRGVPSSRPVPPRPCACAGADRRSSGPMRPMRATGRRARAAATPAGARPRQWTAQPAAATTAHHVPPWPQYANGYSSCRDCQGPGAGGIKLDSDPRHVPGHCRQAGSASLGERSVTSARSAVRLTSRARFRGVSCTNSCTLLCCRSPRFGTVPCATGWVRAAS
jgi:hypothetical protein